MRRSNPKGGNRGLSHLAKLDWQRRLAALVNLKGRNMVQHAVKDGKIDGKVPVDQVIDLAQQNGLTAILNGDTLFIAKLIKVA